MVKVSLDKKKAVKKKRQHQKQNVVVFYLFAFFVCFLVTHSLLNLRCWKKKKDFV
jgi:hypothetical protein